MSGRGSNASPEKGEDGRVAIALALGIAVAAAALYWPIRTHEWLMWDDFVYITQNPHIADGLSAQSVWWAVSNFHLANWFPGTWISWMIDFERSGFDAGAFLTTNLVLHAINSVLLFAALRRLTKSTYPSAFAAAVFAVHPLHIESVAWAAARKDVLSGVFWMLALWFQGGDGPALRRRMHVAICFALGFACKPTLVTLPFVLLLLDEWPGVRSARVAGFGGWDRARVKAALFDKSVLFALLLVFAFVTLAAQHSGGTVQDLTSLPIGMRLKNAGASYIAYIAATFWPAKLAFFYPHPGDSVSWPMAAACFAALGAITAGAALARNHRYLIVGWLWFLGTLVPTIGLVQIGAQARADRYMYLPLIGLCVMVAWGVPAMLGRQRRHRVGLVAGALAAIVALAVRTALQIPVWHDSVALFEHGMKVTANNHVAHAQLGGAYLSRGRVQEAIGQYEAALRVSADYTPVANNLAWLLATKPSSSAAELARAVELAELATALSKSTDPSILDTLAVCYASVDRFGDAIEASLRGIALAEQAGDPSLVAEMRSRLALYRTSQPYRETETGSGPS